ncbi:MAG: TetR/AcrR family transcriptional regulator [Saprospiraceae bacterium]
MNTKALTISRKEEILEVSARLFKEKGYASTTMREIAENVGIEAASIYHHFKGKDELLHEICFKVARDYTTKMVNIESTYISPIDKLTTLIRFHIQIVFDNVNGISVTNNEWRHLLEPGLSEFKKARQTYENQLGQIINEGIKLGVLKEVDSTVALYTILSSIRWVEAWYKPEKDIHPNIIENNIIQILMNGLQKAS